MKQLDRIEQLLLQIDKKLSAKTTVKISSVEDIEGIARRVQESDNRKRHERPNNCLGVF